ncbi:fibrinogen-like protein A [Physella acuta]|uniref:fibrinogen-like protein A n=1 Tax=Physella acuta TaxID=109671 RepID=UPI0027DE7D13|nr:fibrinogen-like protein A [Physella acuta]
MDNLLILISSFLVHAALCDPTTEHFNLKNASELTLLPLNKTYQTKSNLVCAAKCVELRDECYSYMYETSTKTCTLGSCLLPIAAVNTSQPANSNKLYSKGMMYCNVQELVTSVGNGSMSSCNLAASLGGVALGNRTIFAAKSPDIFRSCADVKNSTTPRLLVQLSSGLVVMCDTVTDGGGWTIFQRRVNGSVDFYRNWTEYKYGFGDYGVGDFYLGNENVYCLNSKYRLELRIDMTYKGQDYFAYYSNFTLLSESQGYKISFSGYSGTAGDSLTAKSNNQKFSTYDVENDIDPNKNCAVYYRAAWWYSYCMDVQLNGNWGSKVFAKGLMWLNTTGYYDSVSSCEMKIRPVTL